MRHLVVWGVVWASAAGVGIRPAEAQTYTGSINVTNLPAPCTSANNADDLNDAPAIQCAVDNLIPASGGELYFPAGRYWLNTSLNIANKHISLRGAGRRTSRLVWYEGSGHGINFVSNSGSVNHTLNVQSLSVLRGGGAGGDGIHGVWQTPSTYTSRGGTSATLVDVHVSVEAGTPSTSYWQNGVHLSNALNARINTFNMQMDKAANGSYTTSTAITITGNSKGAVISDGHMGRSFYGVYVAGSSERVRIENVETSENEIGYLIDSLGGNNSISNCHAGVLPNGISVASSPNPSSSTTCSSRGTRASWSPTRRARRSAAIRSLLRPSASGSKARCQMPWSSAIRRTARQVAPRSNSSLACRIRWSSPTIPSTSSPICSSITAPTT